MNRHAFFIGLLSAAALASTPLGIDAQASPLAPYLTDLTAQILAVEDREPLSAGPPQTVEARRSFGGRVLAASLGSAGGLLVGALPGAATGEEGSWGFVAFGAFTGSFLGAGVAGGARSEHKRRAFLGSAIGVLGGLAVAGSMDGGGTAPLIGYSLTHGLVTALFAHPVR